MNRIKNIGRSFSARRSGHRNKILASGIFDTAHYGNQVGVKFSGLHSAIAHFLDADTISDVDPHPLFATRWYRRQARLGPHTNALLHFIDHGHLLQHDPHPLFMTSWYLAKNENKVRPGANPLSHYLNQGWKDGCPVHPLFDEAWYLKTYPYFDDHAVNLFMHFVQWSSAYNLNPSEFFDTAWYRNMYHPEDNALAHYMIEGAAKGYDPSPRFKTRWYVRTNADVMRSDVNPLVHFVEVGRPAGRPPLPEVTLDKHFGADELIFWEWRSDRIERYLRPAATYDARLPLLQFGWHPTKIEPPKAAFRRLIIKSASTVAAQDVSSSDAIQRTRDGFGIDFASISDLEREFVGRDFGRETFVLFLKDGDILDALGLEALVRAFRRSTRLCVFDMFFTVESRAFPILLPGFNPRHLEAVDCTFSRFAINAVDLSNILEVADRSYHG